MVVLADAFALATLALLSAVLPLSLLAALGFRDAPFGSVLAPLPVTFGAYVLVNALQVLSVSVSSWVYLALTTVAILAAFAAALNATLVLTERRAL